MGFDLTINLGHVIQFVALIGGGVWFIWEMRTRLITLQTSQDHSHKRLDKIDTELEQLSKVTIELARQEERMVAQDNRIQELSDRINTQVSKFADLVQVIASQERVENRRKLRAK